MTKTLICRFCLLSRSRVDLSQFISVIEALACTYTRTRTHRQCIIILTTFYHMCYLLLLYWGCGETCLLSNSNTLSILLQMHGQPSITQHCQFSSKCMGNLQSMIKMWHECMVNSSHRCIDYVNGIGNCSREP